MNLYLSKNPMENRVLIRHILRVLIYRWYVIALVLYVTMALSLGTAHTDMEGEWLFDRPVSAEIKAAMQEMGPYYHFRTLFDGTFQVSRDEGNSWERLRV